MVALMKLDISLFFLHSLVLVHNDKSQEEKGKNKNYYLIKMPWPFPLSLSLLLILLGAFFKQHFAF